VCVGGGGLHNVGGFLKITIFTFELVTLRLQQTYKGSFSFTL
jgi:hypothetical protein